MSTELIWQTISPDSESTRHLGELLGNNLTGGEIIELAADLGGGKTTFTQGLVKGVGSPDHASSPTFTLSKICKAGHLEVHHFDFYRLDQAGIMSAQLAESVGNPKVVTVVEWAGIVQNVLPPGHIRIKFEPTPKDPDERQITITYPKRLAGIIEAIETAWPQSRP